MRITELRKGRRYRRPGYNPGPRSDYIEVLSIGPKWLRFRPILAGRTVPGPPWLTLVTGWAAVDDFEEVPADEID